MLRFPNRVKLNDPAGVGREILHLFAGRVNDRAAFFRRPAHEDIAFAHERIRGDWTFRIILARGLVHVARAAVRGISDPVGVRVPVRLHGLRTRHLRRDLRRRPAGEGVARHRAGRHEGQALPFLVGRRIRILRTPQVCVGNGGRAPNPAIRVKCIRPDARHARRNRHARQTSAPLKRRVCYLSYRDAS